MASPKKCYKLLGSQYLIKNNDSPERITVKSNIAVKLEFKQFETFHTAPTRFYSRFFTTVKMAHHMEIGKIKSFWISVELLET